MKKGEKTKEKQQWRCLYRYGAFILAIMIMLAGIGQLTACGSKVTAEEESMSEETMDSENGGDSNKMEETNQAAEVADTDAELAVAEGVEEASEENIDQQAELASNEAEVLAQAQEAAQAAEEAAAEAAAQAAAQQATTQATQEDNTIVICIDPGHGGDSDGTKETYDGQLVLEKNLNSRIAASLQSYLEQYSGVRAIITHSVDRDMSFSGRINYAVSNDADYLISVHVNSRSTDEVNSSGCMVLMSCSGYQPANAKVDSLYQSELTLARSILSRLNGLGLQIANDWNTENTGGILQRVNTVGETYPDGSQADYYGLLYNGTYAGIPTIIVEHAFLSNESDYRNYLCTDDKLDALARADAEGIADALGLR